MPANIVFMVNDYTNVKAANVLHLLVASAPSGVGNTHTPNGCWSMDSVWHTCDTDAVSAMVEHWFKDSLACHAWVATPAMRAVNAHDNARCECTLTG